MKKDYDKTSSLKILHAGLENAPQTTLQMYIIISTWGSTGKQINDTKIIASSLTLTIRQCAQETIQLRSPTLSSASPGSPRQFLTNSSTT